jgi:hypothetical protein
MRISTDFFVEIDKEIVWILKFKQNCMGSRIDKTLLRKKTSTSQFQNLLPRSGNQYFVALVNR